MSLTLSPLTSIVDIIVPSIDSNSVTFFNLS